jgi:hypothetical protein
MGIHMAGLPEKRPRPKVPASLHHSFLAALVITALATVYRYFRGCLAEVGNRVRVSSLCENPHSTGPSEPCVGPDFPFVFLPLILPLPHLRRRRCVCACIRLDMFSFSLSLLPLEVSVYLSIFSARLPSNVSAKKQRQVQS